MGLSATQAKLLFITSRQTDVSAKMQRISNQTMILARDEEDISTKYNKMLSATKFQPVKIDGQAIDLSYNTMMGVGAAQGAYKIITSSATDAVVLSPAYAAALGLGDYGDKDKFKQSYGDFNTFAKTMIPALGGTFAALPEKPTVYEVTPQRAEALNNWNSTVKTFMQTNGDFPKATTMNDILGRVPGKWSDYMNDACGARNANIDGTNFGNWIGGLNFSQIANTQSDYITLLAQDGGKVSGVPFDAAKNNFRNIGNVIAIGIGRALGKDTSAGSDYMQQMTNYINQLADTITFCDITKERDTQQAYRNGVNDARGILVGNATETYRRGNDNDFFTLNVSEYVRRLALKAMSMYNGNYAPGTNVRDSNTPSHTAKNNGYTITVNEKGISGDKYENKLKSTYENFSGKALISYDEAKSLAQTHKGNMPAQSAVEKPKIPYTAEEIESNIIKQINQSPFKTFVKDIFDRMSAHGWIMDKDVENNEHMTDKFASGAYKLADACISNNKDYFEPVADTETREKAKGWYEAEMSKINRKEKILSADMNKLQTEYDSLTQDMNSVQAIIQGNVQRSFTFFQA